jgi:hypothetical protein
MRKKIIILILILIAGIGAWYFYSRSKTTATDQGSGLKSFFPFGSDTTTGDNPPGALNQDNETNVVPITNTTNSPFKQLTSHTVAGYTTFDVTTKVTTPGPTPKSKPTVENVVDHILRYVSRNSGYVYEIINGGTPIQISNIYVANIYEAYFADSGKTAILRFLRDDVKTIVTYSVPIPDKNLDGTRTQKDGSFLTDGISSLSVSPDGTTIARITLDGTGSVLSSTNSTNTNRKELLRNPFHEWLVLWGSQKDIYLQTKASGTTDGFLYKVDSVNHRLGRVLGNIKGLTSSISPNGTYVLYSESDGRGFDTKILTTKTGVVRSVGSSILPEKCAWLKNEDLVCAGGNNPSEGVYPDVWYAGTISFSDQIFKIHTATNIFDVLYTPSGNQSFDMTNLQVDEDSGLLYFIDKQSGILWQFTL